MESPISLAYEAKILVPLDLFGVPLSRRGPQETQECHSLTKIHPDPCTPGQMRRCHGYDSCPTGPTPGRQSCSCAHFQCSCRPSSN